MTFFAKPTTYQGDREKVAFAASYLTDSAQNHYTSLLQYSPNHPALHSWEGFINEFRGMFGIANVQVEAEQNLRQLQMSDHDHFTNHIIRFEGYAYDSSWNYPALQSELYRSLPTRIKEAMKVIPRPETYQELRDLAMQVDHRHWEYEAETRRNQPRNAPPNNPAKGSRGPNRTNFNNRQDQAPRNPPNNPRPPPAPNGTRPNNTSGAAPNPRPNNPPAQGPPAFGISEEERERRHSHGLCMRCGGEGHYSRNCPDGRPAGRAVFTLTEDGEDFVESYEVEEEREESLGPQMMEEEENAEAAQELPGDA